MKLGIDFGTTNSAVAVVGDDGRARPLELFDGERTQRTVIHGSPDGVVRFGNEAFRSYLEHDLEGRFLRSIKAFLPHDVPRTALCGRMVSFPELVSSYLVFLRERVEDVLDEEVTEVVVGRPVRFHADDAKHDAAVQRLTEAVDAAGIRDWRLQLEPVAAAHRYEQDLDRERIVLVGDFGGGTADFAVLRAGPDRRGDRLDDILATSGVAEAGDAVDGRFLDTFLLDAFGRGARIKPRYADDYEPWDHPVLRHIQRLYYLHLLRTDDLAQRLDYVEAYIDDKVAIRRLRRLIFDDLGYPMAWSVEKSKRALSDTPSTTFRFDEFYHDTLNLSVPVDRPRMEAGCEALLCAYDRAIDEVLAAAGLDDQAIDDVFLTGGTAQLPFLRARFARRFGSERLRSADAFTSVCEGLALS
jgi:hypothetical chaperone protein